MHSARELGLGRRRWGGLGRTRYGKRSAASRHNPTNRKAARGGLDAWRTLGKNGRRGHWRQGRGSLVHVSEVEDRKVRGRGRRLRPMHIDPVRLHREQHHSRRGKVRLTRHVRADGHKARQGRESHRVPPHPPGGALPPGCGRLIERRQKLRRGGRIAQQVAERLLSRQGVEQRLVVERGFEKRLAFLRRERAGGVSAQQLSNLVAAHRLTGSQSPPINSIRCLRHRWSQV